MSYFGPTEEVLLTNKSLKTHVIRRICLILKKGEGGVWRCGEDGDLGGGFLLCCWGVGGGGEGAVLMG